MKKAMSQRATAPYMRNMLSIMARMMTPSAGGSKASITVEPWRESATKVRVT